MKNFTKNYIGKGKQINTMDIVKITLKMEDIMKFKYEKEGAEYVTFEIARMREADKYGRTHTAYVSTMAEEPAVAPKKSTRKRSVKK